uniref:Uncharacterized protein n=1 Tax=Physcomitrium patens TaxID=3218 RepID=A0A2K1KEE9_PHYPA|nr:uncharacterized protein LOC112283730 [Physcomitrium patens]PNR52154.1 hypothetical protein PHYPA_008528 [Physcomitrium patens]|eukprot:XP_024378553.1 uncharacterized protein LOC112283730 [Physcomitrella patens]
MKEKKNPMSCFDDIGVDFLSAWKPGNMSSVPNLDFECSQPSVSGKAFKIPNNFDMEIDFGTQSGLSSKLSSFDIDFDFLKSPKYGDLDKGNRREPQMTCSEHSKDSLEYNTKNDASLLSGQEQLDPASKTRVVEEKLNMKCQNQIEPKRASKTADSAEAFSWGSQSEMTRAYLDSSDKRTIKEINNDMLKVTAHDGSSPKSLEEAVLQGWYIVGEQTESAPEITKQSSGEGATASTFQSKEQQKQNLPPVEALSNQNDSVVTKIVDHQDASVQQRSTEGVPQGKIEENDIELQSNGLVAKVGEATELTDIQPREIKLGESLFVVGPFETVAESQINNEQVRHINQAEKVPCEITDVAQTYVTAGVTHTREGEPKASLVSQVLEVTTHWTDLLPSIVGDQTKASCAKINFEVEEEFPGSEQNVDSPVQRVISRNSMKGRLQRNSQRATRPAAEERNSSDLPSRKTNEDRTSQPATERNNNIKRSPLPAKVARSFLTKDISKVDVPDSRGPLKTVKTIDRKQKDNLSVAFKSLKPTQVSSLRTSRSHALPPLRSEKQIEDPTSNENGENLRMKLKPPVNVKTISLETPIHPPTRAILSSKRGPPEEQSADEQEDYSKRPKVQAAHQSEAENHQLKPLYAGQGKSTSAPSLALEKLSVSKHASSISGQSLSRLPSSNNKLGPQPRIQETGLGPAAARIDIHRAENIPAISKSLCVRSPPRNHKVDIANIEVVKQPASAMTHKLESGRRNQKKSKIISSHSQLENTIENLTGAMNHKHEVFKNIEYQKTHGKQGSQLPLRDNRMGCTNEVHEKRELRKLKESCTQLRSVDTMGQVCPNETTFGTISKTTADCSVELDEILSMLQQKQRSANDLLAEVMAHNAKLKFLLDSKNNEKIITLQKSIEEKLEEVKMQATGNRAKRCKLCEEKREGEAAALVKECCDTIHRCDGQQNIEC